MTTGTPLEARIHTLIEQQAALQLERDTLQGTQSEMERGEPALEADILRAENGLGLPFPPSFRAYLRKHDGWIDFWPSWCLLGVSGKLTERMMGNITTSIADKVEMAEADAADEGEDPEDWVSHLREEQLTDPNIIYAPDHPVIGTTFNGDLLVLDRHRVNAEGEHEVVAVDNLGEVNQRWTSFVALLEAAIEDTRADVVGLRAKRGSAGGE